MPRIDPLRPTPHGGFAGSLHLVDVIVDIALEPRTPPPSDGDGPGWDVTDATGAVIGSAALDHDGALGLIACLKRPKTTCTEGGVHTGILELTYQATHDCVLHQLLTRRMAVCRLEPWIPRLAGAGRAWRSRRTTHNGSGHPEGPTRPHRQL